MKEIELGELVGPDDPDRDAVHIAIKKMRATRIMAPGEVVPGLGIVDPFLDEHAHPGDLYWLFLFPNSVTGMRHHWSHPSFPDEIYDQDQPTKEESEQWLRGFVDNSSCPPYEELLKAAVGEELPNYDPEWYLSAYSVDEHHLHFNGRDAHGSIPPEFWDHVENVTGKVCRFRPISFSCSC